MSSNRYIPRWSRKKKFLLLHLDGYLFTVAYGNRYLSRGSKENALSITIVGNVSGSR